MNVRLVMYLLGRVAIVFGGCMVFPLLMTIVYNENRLAEFGIPVLISIISGILMTRGESPYNNRLPLREGTALICFSFFFLCLMGALPYFMSGYSLVNSLFESVSGFTTTGASAIGDLQDAPKEILLWRSLTQWVGGIGIILVFVTLLPQAGREVQQLFNGELHGESAQRLLPRITETMKVICAFYLLFTAMVAILLFGAGMTPFDAVNHAMTVVSTGGFSTHNEGLRFYNSDAINVIVLICVFIAGGNHILYFQCHQKGWRRLFRDTEYRLYCFIILLFTLMCAYILHYFDYYDLGGCFYHALFQTVAMVSTSGFSISDYEVWHPFCKFCLLLVMFIGGCSGSTAGGIKISRIVILLKISWQELKRTIHPHMVTSIVVTGKPVSLVLINSITRFFFMYILVFFVSTALLSLTEHLSMSSAAGIAAACLASVGAAFETVASVRGYGELSDTAKVVALLTMLIGRLEIFSFFILFHPDFWRKG